MRTKSEREFQFKLTEVDHVYDRNSYNYKKDVISETSGIARVKENGEIEIFVDDDRQYLKTFESKDRGFNKLIKKIHDFTWR
jgi:hypothetical protein